MLETKYLTPLSLGCEIVTPEETGLVVPLENKINSSTNVTFSALTQFAVVVHFSF
jgi:hypothetical protein